MSSKQKYGLSEDKRSYGVIVRVFAFIFLVCHGFACLSWATQKIAALSNYHPSLSGKVWGIVYWPWQCLVWQQAYPDVAAIGRHIDFALIAFAIPLGIALLIALAFQHRPRGLSDVHGTARWADKKDIKKASLLDGKGVYVGGWKEEQKIRYLTHNGPEHILAFAPTRSGKGVGLVLPTLLSWPESTIVLDIKGENWALTAGWRKQQGQKVIKFDPVDMKTGARFNPLGEVRIFEESAIRDVQNVATMILDPDGKGIKDFWDKAAYAFFVGALLHCLVKKLDEGRTASLRDLSLMLADPNLDIHDLLQEMIDTDHKAILEQHAPHDVAFAQEIHDAVAASAQEMRNKADKELSGVLSSAAVNLSLYRDPTIAYTTGASDFCVHDLMNHEKPVSLYLIIRPSEIDRLRPLVRLILNMILRRVTENMDFKDGRSVAGYKHRMLLMLDEFTSLGKLEIMERSLAFMAGYGLKGYLIIQSTNQLEGAYGKEGKGSILGNCHLRIAYAANDRQTAEELSAMTGKTTVVQEKTSVSGNRTGRLKNASVSISEVSRPLLTPDECMRLPGPEKDSSGNIIEAGDMLIFPSGFPTIYGKQIMYFLDPVFSERAKIEAPEMSDVVEIETPKVEKNAQDEAENPQETELFKISEEQDYDREAEFDELYATIGEADEADSDIGHPLGIDLHIEGDHHA